jgi:hypothetical protein
MNTAGAARRGSEQAKPAERAGTESPLRQGMREP